MDSVMERACERKASTERAMPKIGGLGGGQLTGEVSTGHWRTKRGERHHPHVASASKRFGVKPSSGGVADVYTGVSLKGQDDGSDYFSEWRGAGGIFELPRAKTPKQDELRRLCVAFIAGEDLGEHIEDGMREFIAKIQRTDNEHGSTWRVAMMAAGLFR
jgi:hypothetical protein